jgi:hypothetical protein
MLISIHSIIHIQTGTTNIPYESTVPLVREEVVLWQKGTSYSLDLSIIALPFEFRLPNDIPGSFYAARFHHSATVSYGIEVIADRPGIFHRNRRVAQMLSVLPLAFQEDAINVPLLRDGWLGRDWASVSQTAMIRKHFWGHHSEVRGHVGFLSI